MDAEETLSLTGSMFLHISYWIFIMRLFANSRSRPVILNMAYVGCPQCTLESYIVKAIASIYKVKIISLQELLLYIPTDDMVYDGFHFKQSVSNYIADIVDEELRNGVPSPTPKEYEIAFSLYVPSNCGDCFIETKKTSLVKNEVYGLIPGQFLKLPDDRYLCGIYYWLTEKYPLLEYHNKYITICKPLGYYSFKDSFFCRSIGYNYYPGLRGGEVGAQTNRNINCLEKTYGPNDRPSDNTSKLYIAYLLLADRAPLPVGECFYTSNIDVFSKAREEVALLDFQRRGMHMPHLWQPIDELVDDGSTLFREVFKLRPDISHFLMDKEFGTERLLLWAWLHGREEMDVLRTHSGELYAAIQKLLHTEESKVETAPLPKLIHMIWLNRPDLHIFDIDTPKGREEMMRWFISHGKREYKLDNPNEANGGSR